MIRVTDRISIAEWELSESFSRASGPSGQNVNGQGIRGNAYEAEKNHVHSPSDCLSELTPILDPPRELVSWEGSSGPKTNSGTGLNQWGNVRVTPKIWGNFGGNT